jgi:hypothetical protein
MGRLRFTRVNLGQLYNAARRLAIPQWEQGFRVDREQSPSFAFQVNILAGQFVTPVFDDTTRFAGPRFVQRSWAMFSPTTGAMPHNSFNLSAIFCAGSRNVLTFLLM